MNHSKFLCELKYCCVDRLDHSAITKLHVVCMYNKSKRKEAELHRNINSARSSATANDFLSLYKRAHADVSCGWF